MKEEKRKRFKRVASKRVEKLLKSMQVLSNCSNRNNYEYTSQDIDKMMKALREELKKTEAMFRNNLPGEEQKKFKF